MHQLQPFALYLLDDDAEDILLALLVLWQENQARSVFSLLGYWNALQ